MKRIMLVIFSMMLCFTLVACVNDNKPQDDVSSSKPNQAGNDLETSNSIVDNSDIDLPGVLSINLENVKYCVNSPSKQIFNKGYSFVNMENYFVV